MSLYILDTDHVNAGWKPWRHGISRWRVEGLLASPDGHVTLALPGDWLRFMFSPSGRPPNRSVLAVRDQASGELVADYLVELRHSATEAR